MGKIRILDEQLANQIAAGEVVERPASVVKELVENSIDAGSTVIDVSVEDGGLTSIKVQDNGSGIEEDDCLAAFERHATSKIRTGKDLFQIRTLGFRGEALPSIAAVSRLECLTSANADGAGKRIVVEGGNVVSVEDAAAPKGTVMIVRDLFFNTPARLKYMKTVQTELRSISDYLYRLALACPHIAFTFRHNSKLLLQTLGNGDMLQVIAAIYGTSAARHMVKVRAENMDYVLDGYISRPEVTRANRSAMSTMVNGRYIRNFMLAKAITNAYHTLLPIDRYPLVAVNIRMDPSLVDVNVHPAKLEVRFSKEQELLDFIEQELKRTLSREVLIPSGQQKQVRGTAVIQEKIDFSGPALSGAAASLEGFSAAVPRAGVPGGSESAAISAEKGLAEKGLKEWTVRETKAPERNGPAANRPQDLETNRQPGTPSSRIAPPPPPKLAPPPAPQYRPASGKPVNDVYPAAEQTVPELPAFPKLYPIGQMHGTYILAQNEDGLYLIDQHAAHERIHYEYFYEQFGKPRPASQELLLPITVEVTPAEAELLMERLALLQQVGVFMEHFGGNTFKVTSYPYWFPEGEETDIIREMVEWILSEKKAVDVAKLREKSAILCSCKASIKANDYLSMRQIEQLLDRLASCKNPYTCPHGRPVVVSFSNYDLQKMFKRVM
jgi:DNA mismatch repair protein MutL